MQKRLLNVTIYALMSLLAGLTLTACGGSDGGSSSTSEETSSTSTSSSSSSSSSGSSSSGGPGSGGSSSSTESFDPADYADITVGDCASDSDIETVVCAAEAFIATLSSDEQNTLLYDWSDATAKTTWSNFPVDLTSRNGIGLGELGEESRLAAMVVARAALSDAGYEDFLGMLAADNYLNEQGGGSAYSSGNYFMAFIGYPITGGSWMLQLGGHHLAYNITYLGTVGYPVPHHIGAEPKVGFEINSSSYAPLEAEGNALEAMFGGLDSDQLYTAYLSGQSYNDVLMGPDNGSGEMPSGYPSGSDRGGMLVSSLSEEQQALVVDAIKQWVSDYPADVADGLLADYTSTNALADTYIAWAGDQSAGVDVDVQGTYMRIDGPRLWLEVACQGGIVIRGETHYHTIFRDKSYDYGNSL